MRILLEDRRRLFEPLRRRLEKEPVVMEFPPGDPGPKRCDVLASPSFWEQCPEFRKSAIGIWMKEHGDAPWEHHEPPRYVGKLSIAPSINIRIQAKIAK